MTKTVIQVHGHTRAWALRYVLEGLRRQDALPITQVWLDGHHEKPELRERVLACRALQSEFPEAQWICYGSLKSFAKLFLDAAQYNIPRYDNIIVLEDDCFPAPDAVSELVKGLDRIRDDPNYFSVYGHHFGTEDEGEETTAFQCWGWATTSPKMRFMLDGYIRLWDMPEPECVAWLEANITDEIRTRMNVYRGRSTTRTIKYRFCYDGIIAFLVAQARMMNRKTPHQVVYNFGIGRDSGTFRRPVERVFKPPYNMISEMDLVKKFDLPSPGGRFTRMVREYRLHKPNTRLAKLARALNLGS